MNRPRRMPQIGSREPNLENLRPAVVPHKFGRRPSDNGASLIEYDQFVAQSLGLVHEVSGEYLRQPFVTKCAQAIPDQVSGLRVEAGRRLVEEQHLGLVHQGARKAQASAHSARELVDARRTAISQLGEREQFVAATPQLATADSEKLAVVDKIVTNREVGVEGVRLRHDADPRSHRPPVRAWIVPKHLQLATRSGTHAGDHADSRRLAGAVRAQNAEYHTVGNRKVQTVNRRAPAILFHDAIGRDRNRTHSTGAVTDGSRRMPVIRRVGNIRSTAVEAV